MSCFFLNLQVMLWFFFQYVSIVDKYLFCFILEILVYRNCFWINEEVNGSHLFSYSTDFILDTERLGGFFWRGGLVISFNQPWKTKQKKTINKRTKDDGVTKKCLKKKLRNVIHVHCLSVSWVNCLPDTFRTASIWKILAPFCTHCT